MENQNLIPKKQSESTEIAAFETHLPVLDQRDQIENIAAALVLKWMEVERIIVKAPEIQGREDSTEELEMMSEEMKNFQTLTPKEFGDSIRRAGKRAEEIAFEENSFPKLPFSLIRSEFMKTAKKKIEAQNEAPALPQNVGGNTFWGEPSEAIIREWPKIVAHTMKVREETDPDYRYRFWLCSNEQEKQAAFGMLRQMSSEMMQSPMFVEGSIAARELDIYKREYWTAYPDWRGVVDELKTIRQPAPLEAIKAKTEEKIKMAYRMGSAIVPPITMLPDPKDCICCAVFDAYLEYWQELQSFSTAEIVE